MSLHFLIDGYNLIKRNPNLATKSLEDGRQGLVTFIERSRPHGSLRNKVTVVFDGQPGMYGLPSGNEVSVVFTEYESADDLIKTRVEEAKNKKEIVVVTDDKALLLYVRSFGVTILSVREFYQRGAPPRPSSKGGGKPVERSKVITSGFENTVNKEFEKIWLEKKPKKE